MIITIQDRPHYVPVEEVRLPPSLVTQLALLTYLVSSPLASCPRPRLSNAAHPCRLRDNLWDSGWGMDKRIDVGIRHRVMKYEVCDTHPDLSSLVYGTISL